MQNFQLFDVNFVINFELDYDYKFNFLNPQNIISEFVARLDMMMTSDEEMKLESMSNSKKNGPKQEKGVK